VEELNITQSLTLCFKKLKQRKLKITVRFLAQIPVPTVKWVANRNKPIKNSSGILTISEDGNLVVLQGQSYGRVSSILLKISTDVRTGKKVQLTSWKSPSDPSLGNFSAGIDVCNLPEFFVWNEGSPYWWSGPWNSRVFILVL